MTGTPKYDALRAMREAKAQAAEKKAAKRKPKNVKLTKAQQAFIKKDAMND